MKKNILISMYALQIGGAERSLIGLLESIDYEKFHVDLFLYRHEGEFLTFLPKEVNVLPAIKEYTTFERPIKDVLKEGYIHLACARILAKLKAKWETNKAKDEDGTYKQMQYTWHYSIGKLPKLEKKYDAAISFLGPHHFLLDKVEADVKLGWNHTDYFTAVHPNKDLDEAMWNRLDYIVNVSEDCRESFLKVFPQLEQKAVVMENIISSEFVEEQSREKIDTMTSEDQAIKICSVGRLSHVKGFDMAIKACKQLIESGYNIKWYVIGYGAEEEKLKQLIVDYHVSDQFILLGKKANPYPYIKNCDIYCQPSRCEGKAVTVREAQIIGKPVVITNFLTAKSQLEANIDGYICDLSVEGIVQGIEQLYHNVELRKFLADNCKKRDYSNKGEMKKLYSYMRME